MDIREQIEWLTAAEEGCMDDERPLAAESYSQIRNTMEKLLAVYEAAQWFSMHMPENHVYGLIEKGNYRLLRDAIAAVQTRQDGNVCCDGFGVPDEPEHIRNWFDGDPAPETQDQTRRDSDV